MLKTGRASKSYSMKQTESLRTKNTSLQLECNTLKERSPEQKLKIDEITEELNEPREENEYLRLLVNEHQLILFDSECKIYTPETQECVYALLILNVTTRKVSPVIETVLKLANFKPNKLPTVTTINNMNIQRLLLSKKKS